MMKLATLLWILGLFAALPAAHAETALTAAQLHEHCLRYIDEQRSSAGIGRVG